MTEDQTSDGGGEGNPLQFFSESLWTEPSVLYLQEMLDSFLFSLLFKCDIF